MKLYNVNLMLNCIDYGIRGMLVLRKWHQGQGSDWEAMRDYEKDHGLPTFCFLFKPAFLVRLNLKWVFCRRKHPRPIRVGIWS